MHLGIDVDLTTLASDEAWWRWLHYMSNGYTDRDPVKTLNSLKERDWGELEYGLWKYFPKMINHNIHPLDFWRHEGAYDIVGPVHGAQYYIRELMKLPKARVVFVTHNKGNGGRSKYNNLVRLFGYGNFDFIVTKEKHLTKIDCLIDDRLEFMNHCADSGIASFRIDTAMKQTERQHSNVVLCRGWKDIHDRVVKWYDAGRPSNPKEVNF